MFITITNSAKEIKETNYFDTPHAKQNLIFLSINANCARLLLPDGLTDFLDEMRTGKYVILSSGIYKNKNAIEILFEDDSDSPFSIHIEAKQCDRILPKQDDGIELEFKVYTREGEKLNLPAKFRMVDKLPCLKAWGK
jgi:hypothetical protein